MKPYWFAALIVTIFLVIGASAWPVAHRSLVANRQPASNNQGYGHGAVNFSNVSVRVLIPTTTATQEKGLAGRTSLPDNEGMLWQFDRADRYTFWMKGMLIPLDFIWLANSQVVDITTDVPPPPDGNSNLLLYQSSVPADMALEVAGGFAARQAVQRGDVVRIDRD